jgi:aspartate/methionine/tyrosine aminotransferase
MAEIPFSGIREIFEECGRLEAGGTDVVHLEIGRPDFDTPQPIKNAAIEAIEAGHVHYTSNYGIEPLRRALSEKLAAENGVEYDPNGELVVTAGASEAVFVTIVALVDEGDEVLVPDPCWTYPPSICAAEATPVGYELDPDTGFQPDLDSLRDAVSDDTELLVVNSPHNRPAARSIANTLRGSPTSRPTATSPSSPTRSTRRSSTRGHTTVSPPSTGCTNGQ